MIMLDKRACAVSEANNPTSGFALAEIEASPLKGCRK